METANTLLIWVESFNLFFFQSINKNSNQVQTSLKTISEQGYVRSPGDAGIKLFKHKTNRKIVGKL